MVDRRLLRTDEHAEDTASEDGGSMAGDGPDERERQTWTSKDIVRLVAFVSSVLSALSAGGIAAFSLYGPLLLTRLHYTQFRVNVIAVTAEMLMYLTAPLFGYLCDRVRPSLVSSISAILFGSGYLLAAFAYRSGPPPDSAGLADGSLSLQQQQQQHNHHHAGWPFGVMVMACHRLGHRMHNYATSKHKGIMLAVPIAAFGLSGIWYSVLAKFFVYRGADTTAYKDGSGVDLVHGDVDVFRFFIFLAIMTFTVGVIGAFALNVVDEDKLIEAGAEELERSGLLTETDGQYGTFRAGHGGDDDNGVAVIAPGDQEKKTWLLNQETKLFLNDNTMWLLSLGFILISGPGEAYMNNASHHHILYVWLWSNTNKQHRSAPLQVP
ncbi:putative monocarboxylate transporter mch1 [Microsporum audouinii]